MNFSDIVTFSRASAAWERRSDGLYYSVGNNVARQADYWWNGSALERAGLLIEGARTNLLTYSHDLNNAAWSQNGSPTIDATGIDPLFDGKTAYKFTNDNAGTGRSVAQAVGAIGAAAVAAYVDVENVDAVTTDLLIVDSTLMASIVLTWADGSVVLAGNGSGKTGGAIDLGTGPNGGQMYRLWVSGVSANTGDTATVYVRPTGDAQSALSVIVHHVQYEVAAFPSSPILTDGASATRAADVATIATSGWFADGQAGSLYAETMRPIAIAESNSGHYIANLYASNTNRISWSYNGDNKDKLDIVTANVAEASIVSAAAATGGDWVRSAIAFAPNDAVAYRDGTSSGTDSSVVLPSGLATLYLGAYTSGLYPLFGYIRNLRYWPRRLANAELDALTE